VSEPAQVVDFDQDGRDLYQQWINARSQAEQWGQERDRIAQQLATMMGEATRGTIDGRHVVTYVRPTTISSFNVARFHDAQPDVWAAYVEQKPRAGYLMLPREPKR
jgi:hypothetical protein